MDIADVDLNLLVVFDALLRHRSVSGAARALKMSQPATSFALNRLRKMFGEPLFVRTSRGIHPTPYAESLSAPLEAILERIRADLLQQPTFDPSTEQRSVTFNMQDIGELVFLPQILGRLNKIAPGLQLRTVNLPAPLLKPALRSGEVDIALGHFPDLAGAALFQQRLFSHSFVCIVRADHPTIKDEMTRRQFLDGLHAVVHPAGHMNDSLEAELQAQGLMRKVSVRIEHFLAVPTILSQSNLIFTVPYAIGEGLAKLADIKLVKPPFKAKPRVIRQHWHARYQRDAANRWLRSVVAELFMDKEIRPRTKTPRRQAT
ncbi:LysR family transcriptional regulator [Steroidobacter flavus]|uniref:LysR family transcriptional regulator n=1 Tax=Steroidobacter flavus TaxID=1842136 RepID=A0ABV8SZX8_9GAMM